MSKNNKYNSQSKIMLASAMIVLSIAGQSFGYAKGTHSEFLGGPYEILVQKGMEGSPFVFPVKVPDENKAGKLESLFPVIGSPIKVRLKQFLPNLSWETYTIKTDQGDIVARLRALGNGLDQEIWLSPGDPARKSITSSIGSVSIKTISHVSDFDKKMKQLTNPESVGILSVWHKDPNTPIDYVVLPGTQASIANSQYKFKVEEYLPHYSVDPETKKILNASVKPVNPAVKLSFSEGEKVVEQWIFSRFPTHPHIENKIPIRVEFSDFDLAEKKGDYVIAVGKNAKPWIFFAKDGKKYSEEAKLNAPYPFAMEGYSFVLEEFFSGVEIKQRWGNKSDTLLHPAIIATVEQDGAKEDVVLELNKPNHFTSGKDTIVLLYRRKVEQQHGVK